MEERSTSDLSAEEKKEKMPDSTWLKLGHSNRQSNRSTLARIRDAVASLEVQWKVVDELIGSSVGEVEEREVKVRVREEELEEREDRVRVREREFEDRVKEVEERFRVREEELEEREGMVRVREREFEDRVRVKEGELEKKVREVEVREKELEERAQGFRLKYGKFKELLKNERKLKDKLKEIGVRDKGLRDRVKEVEAKERCVKELGLKESELEEKGRELELREKGLWERVKEVEAREQWVKELGLKENELEEKGRAIEVREKVLEEWVKEIELKDLEVKELRLKEKNVEEKLRDLEMREKILKERVRMFELREQNVASVTHNVKVKSEPVDEDFLGGGVSVDASVQLCVMMDGKALQIFLNERWKEHDLIRNEVFVALGLSADPAMLVLDAMDGFFPSHLTNGNVKFEEDVVRRSCLLLLEELMKFSPKIRPCMRDKAMALACYWFVRMRADSEHFLEVWGFLQLLASYGLGSLFKVDFLMSYLEIVAHHNLAPGLLRALGLANRSSKIKQCGNLLLESKVASCPLVSEAQPICPSEKMDWKGLRKLMNMTGNFSVICEEVTTALQFAFDPAKLVLDALWDPLVLEESKDFQLGCPKVYCLLLLKQLKSLSPQIKPQWREEALKLATHWNQKLVKGRDDQLEVVCFLQFLAAYNLASSFESFELLSLLDAGYWQKRASYFLQILSLQDSISDCIEEIVKMDKRLEAIKHVLALGITDKFPPGALLSDHLDSSKKNANALRLKNHNSIPVQIAAFVKEIGELDDVIRCVTDYNLKSEFSLENLKDYRQKLQKQLAETKQKLSSKAGSPPEEQSQKKRSAITANTDASKPSIPSSTIPDVFSTSTAPTSNICKIETQEQHGNKRSRVVVSTNEPPKVSVGSRLDVHSQQMHAYQPSGLWVSHGTQWANTPSVATDPWNSFFGMHHSNGIPFCPPLGPGYNPPMPFWRP